MVFEDGTHYEGEFKSAGIFYGKGTLTFRTGDRLEGNMNGVWDEGIKVIATLHMNNATENVQTNTKPMYVIYEIQNGTEDKMIIIYN